MCVFSCLDLVVVFLWVFILFECLFFVYVRVLFMFFILRFDILSFVLVILCIFSIFKNLSYSYIYLIIFTSFRHFLCSPFHHFSRFKLITVNIYFLFVMLCSYDVTAFSWSNLLRAAQCSPRACASVRVGGLVFVHDTRRVVGCRRRVHGGAAGIACMGLF